MSPTSWKVTLDPTEGPTETALRFRHNLIGFCLNHSELGLANEDVFTLPINVLVAEISMIRPPAPQ